MKEERKILFFALLLSPGFLLIPHSGSVIIFEDSFLVVGG
jgi:hypothetical protein